MMFRCCLATLALAASGLTAIGQTQSGFGAANSSPADSLRLQYANGIVAVAEDKIITVADVMREIMPLLPQLRADARDEKDYQQRLETLQDGVIQDLIDRVLIIKEFRKDEKRHIPDSYIDNAVADDLAERFEGDRSKFLAYLRSQGKTMREFRKDKEEEIIYSYMRSQQKKSQSVVSPVRIETYYNENKDRFYREDEIHLRIIQLARNDETSTDAALMEKARQVLARFKAGEKFEDLAKEYSSTARSKGGDWGWIQRSNLKAEFSEPAFKLQKGEVSEPILLPDACYLVFAEDRRFAGIQSLDEVRDTIERMLITQMTRTSQERWLERLRRNGYVKHY
jgi:peptidyl-prolyl cis-trans isomerase SurA